jgi:flagellar motor switch protein FliG
MSGGGQAPVAIMTGRRKAAILLVLLGEDAATTVYKSLPEEELSLITQEIADMGYVSPELATNVLEEYHKLSMTQEYLSQGGPEYATKVLKKAFGDEGAQSLLDQVMRAQEASAQNLDTLQRADPHQLAKFIQAEHPQTVALVLAHLSPRAATAVLALLPEKLRALAIRRLAQMQQFSPEMVKKIALVLHRKLLSLGSQSRRAYGGVKAVADLLNRMDQGASGEILLNIEQENGQLAASIRNLMFTFEDFLEVPEQGLRELLGNVDKKNLAIALKAATEDLRNRFFKCMSQRAVEMLKEDMETIGPLRSKDINHAQQEVVAAARKLESEGKIMLKPEVEENYVV